MFVSKYLGIDKSTFRNKGIFDSVVERDSNFFVNIVRLRNTDIPEFKQAYSNLNAFFDKIISLLDSAKQPDSKKDLFYETAEKDFSFSENNGVNLGFSHLSHGKGLSGASAKAVLRRAYDIVKEGVKKPEIFHLVPLFVDNIGPDKLSDMIVSIIEPDIKAYTCRMLKELNVRSNGKLLEYDVDGLVVNKYRKVPIYLVPEELLDKLPIANGWDDIDDAVRKNEKIRSLFNESILSEWGEWSSNRKKQAMFDIVICNADHCKYLFSEYSKLKCSPFDVQSDLNYFAENVFEEISRYIRVEGKTQYKYMPSFNIMLEIIESFKQWVEYGRGWDVIQNYDTRKREKLVQALLRLVGDSFAQANQLDLSFESNAGRGPVDIKLSRGDEKVIVEVKLSTNQHYLDGMEKQINEYGIAEKAKKRIYLYVDLGNPQRLEKLKEAYRVKKNSCEDVITLIIIDATSKVSASKCF